MAVRHLRAAAALGVCAVALTFAAVPAQALDDPFAPIVLPTPTVPAPTTTATAPTSTPTPTPSSTDPGIVVSPSGGATSTPATDDPDDSDAGAGTTRSPAIRLDRTTSDPARLASNGVTAIANGLTPGAQYRATASSGGTTTTIGGVITADAWGWLTFTWRPQALRPGTWAVTVQGVDDPSVQVRQPLRVRNETGIAWRTPHRHGRTVVLAVVVQRTAASGAPVAWPHAVVRFQEHVHGRWVRVRTVRADAKGVARATIHAGVATWRAVAPPTATDFGTRTAAHRR